MVQQIAAPYSIDPQLVLAVMQAESGFNPGALSPKNAQGLMQLIPATAQRFGVKNAWDPAENIRGGAAYLHWLIRHFSGKVEWVLAAYNAGEHSVERYRGVPPYSETQAYVQKILSRYGKLTHPVPPERSRKAVL
jgi:soluble lytic murein transglycosylase-like protein